MNGSYIFFGSKPGADEFVPVIQYPILNEYEVGDSCDRYTFMDPLPYTPSNAVRTAAADASHSKLIVVIAYVRLTTRRYIVRCADVKPGTQYVVVST